MELPKGLAKPTSVGEAAVEGLIYGIVAGLGMALFVVLYEWLAGVMPLEVLGYFGTETETTPWIGLFTHAAVSGIYGVIFGVLALAIARWFGGRMNPAMWLALGLLYGLLILVVAKGLVLPRTTSPLDDMPLWALGGAHAFYGLLLGWLVGRKF